MELHRRVLGSGRTWVPSPLPIFICLLTITAGAILAEPPTTEATQPEGPSLKAQDQSQSGESNTLPLSFGVFPFLAASHVADGFSPLIAQLQAQLQQTIQYRSTRDYRQYMELLDQGAFDLAYVQPFDYVRLAEPKGYRCLVHRPRALFAKIVVNHRSPSNGLEDLRGKTLGLPPEVAAISYVSRSLIRRLELDRGERPIQLKHFRTHDSCLQQLLVDNVDACAVGDSAAREFENRMNLELKIIAETPSIPPSLIVGHSRLGDARLKRIQRILHQMEQAPATRTILGLVASEQLIPASDFEYNPVRDTWNALNARPSP